MHSVKRNQHFKMTAILPAIRSQLFRSRQQPQSENHRLPPALPLHVFAIGMFCLLMSVHLATAGDTLQWDPSGTSKSFTSTNWYDITNPGALVGPGGTTDYNTLQFVGAGTNSQDAPMSMSVGASTSFTSLTFNNNFNSSNTTTISNGTTSNYIIHIQNGGSITDNATNGTVTFSATNTGNLTFDLYGTNTVTIANGAQMIFDSSVVLDNEGSTKIGGIAKAGGGTLTLGGANTYTGATAVNGGTLLVSNTSGSATGTGAVTVNNSGTLGGTGIITGTVTVAANGTLNPGPSGAAGSTAAVGTLHTGALTLQSGSFSNFDVSDMTMYDKLVSSGAIAFGGTLDVNIASGLNFTNGQMLNLFSGTSETGVFTGIADNQLVTFDGYTFMADYTGSGFTLTAVPEPSTWVAGALALLRSVTHRDGGCQKTLRS